MNTGTPQPFSNDLYVSFNHGGNERLLGKPISRWVGLFVGALTLMLERRLGREVSLVWHKPLLGNPRSAEDYLRESLQSAVFVAVLSPGYMASRSCIRELEAYVV